MSPNGMVHIHALVFGEFISQKQIAIAWSKAIGEPGVVVDVRAVGSTQRIVGALKEVLKYAIKCEKGQRRKPQHAAAVEIGFRNVHRIALGGVVRSVRVTEGDGATDDARPEDLHDTNVLACENCGAEGQWKWVGKVSAEVVEANGGFGAFLVDETYAAWSG
ncbi:MAG: hypothetical protein M3P26_10435 [Gemmatimonadota bacterium]|nr:hypothetical protein [Gemmatimonadota bacterium]